MKEGGSAFTALAFPRTLLITADHMKENRKFDVIIVGGSYSGLSAGMALGRSIRRVLIIDSGKPCNWQTPHSHNFLTQDGRTPKEISTLARQQVERYDSVSFLNGLAVKGIKSDNGFDIQTGSGEIFQAKKLIFAAGVKDIIPDVKGFAECWGISILHCPYCHGYEVKNERMGILANGDVAFEFSSLISNWTKDLTVLTNGVSTLTPEQTARLASHSIKIIEKEIERFDHKGGYVQNVVFKDGSMYSLKALYTRLPFEQRSNLPQVLGCELTEDGYIRVDGVQKTSVPGIFACGDSTVRMRSVSNAVATGSTAGVMANKEMITEAF